ncbi:MAG: hypothetical protein RBU27_10995, partial [Bacteroidota bacterium]|nr:hypothetical protein [Bacteroidota bacterium]
MRLYYSDASLNLGELEIDEIEDILARQPYGKHFVWRPGWSEWLDARAALQVLRATSATSIA